LLLKLRLIKLKKQLIHIILLLYFMPVNAQIVISPAFHAVQYVRQDTTYGEPCPGLPEFTDDRDGNVYPTVQIGNQCWMGKNLAYLPSVVGPGIGSNTTAYYYVYGYSGTDVAAAKTTSNYTTYGVLYNWSAAMNGATSSTANPSGVQGVCPTGWHLPSDAEWEQLEIYLANNGHNYDGTIGYYNNPREKIAKAMAATTHWESSSSTGAVGNNLQLNNSSGFTALPGGYRSSNGDFRSIGYSGYWWSATELTTNYAWYRTLNYNYTIFYRDHLRKELGFSVRCVRDN
jgi:uncharacterized protein (TIGR02145 family)